MEEKGQERVRCVWMGTLGQEGWYPSECAFVKATGCQKGEKIESECPQGEGGEGRKPAEDSKALSERRVVFQSTGRLCRGRESLLYLLQRPPELSVELLQLCLLKFQPCNCSLQTFQPLRQESLL